MKRLSILLGLILVVLLSGCISEAEETISYNVSFNSYGGSLVDDLTVDEGSTFLEPSWPTKDGYTFKGWYSDSSYNSNYNFTYPVIGDIELHAEWSANTITISFLSDIDIEVDDITYRVGTLLMMPNDPEVEGYTFEGWYYETDFLTLFTSNQSPLVNTVLYAKWTISSSTIKFIDHDGTVLKTINAEYGEDLTSVVYPEDPFLEYYTFIEWDTVLPDTMGIGNIVVKAVYNIELFSMSFDSLGGTIINPITFEYNEPIYVHYPTLEGHTFEGWFLDENLTIPFEYIRMPGEDLLLYAKYRINAYSIDYFYYLDGTFNLVKTSEYLYGEDLSAETFPELPTFLGSIFDYWSDTLPTNMPGNPLTFIAYYKEDIILIDFDSNGGSLVDSQILLYDSVLAAPDAPTKEGYTFGGWFTDETYTVEYLFDVKPEENIILHALWEINSYSIQYIDYDETPLMSTTLEYGEEFILKDEPVNMERTGYTFDGWSSNYFETMPNKDLILKAQYKIDIDEVLPENTCTTGHTVVVHYHRWNEDYDNMDFWLWGYANEETGPTEIIGFDSFGAVGYVCVDDETDLVLGILPRTTDWAYNDRLIDDLGNTIDKEITIKDAEGNFIGFDESGVKHIYILQGSPVVYEIETEDAYFQQTGVGQVVVIYYDPLQSYEGWNIWTWGNGDVVQYPPIDFQYDLGIDQEVYTENLRVGIINIGETADYTIGFIVRTDAWEKKCISNIYIDVTNVRGSGIQFVFYNSEQCQIFYYYEDFIDLMQED